MASGSFPFRAKSRKFAGIAPGGIETGLSSTAPDRKGNTGPQVSPHTKPARLPERMILAPAIQRTGIRNQNRPAKRKTVSRNFS
jgi:hypothetical protein